MNNNYKLSIGTISELYLDFNERYFDGILPTKGVKYSIEPYIGIHASFVYKKDGSGIKFIFSNLYKWNKDILERILLHEMIHAYLYVKNGNPCRNHGRNFKKESERFLKHYNIIIPKGKGYYLDLNDKGLKKKKANEEMYSLSSLAIKFFKKLKNSIFTY